MDVHGVLYNLALSDIAALDRYEEIGRGLYVKLSQPALRASAAPVQALVYIGREEEGGVARPDYLAGVLAAARDWDLPQAYVTHLTTFAGMKSVANPEAAGRRGWVRTSNR